jgi:hypothetical protein
MPFEIPLNLIFSSDIYCIIPSRLVHPYVWSVRITVFAFWINLEHKLSWAWSHLKAASHNNLTEIKLPTVLRWPYLRLFDIDINYGDVLIRCGWVSSHVFRTPWDVICTSIQQRVVHSDGKVIFIQPSRQALISSILSTESDIRNLRRKQQEFDRAWEASRSLLRELSDEYQILKDQSGTLFLGTEVYLPL